MAAVTNWIRRGLDTASAYGADVSTSIQYTSNGLRPVALNVVVVRRDESELLPPRRIQLTLEPTEVRHIGDAVVDFLTRLDS